MEDIKVEDVERAVVISSNIKNFNCWEFAHFKLDKKDSEVVLNALKMYINSAYGQSRTENMPLNEIN